MVIPANFLPHISDPAKEAAVGFSLIIAKASLTGLVVACVLGAATAHAYRNYSEYSAACRAQGGTPSPNPPRCDMPSASSGGPGGYSGPAIDYEAIEAERLAKEKAAEEKRKADEQAAFIRSRNEAMESLKGLGNFDDKLRDINDLIGSYDFGLKDSNPSSSGKSKQILVGNNPCPGGLNTDTQAVDTRCIRRDGAYLTTQVPELARSPAADRISKGFQAVINKDWPVALAWWQDALNRDPNNAALKRSVALAQWMVDRRKAIAAGPPTAFNIAVRAAARGDNAEAIRQFELAKVENPASAPNIDLMITAIRQKSAQQARRAALDDEMTIMQIELVGMLHDEGLKMLVIGMDKEAQRLFTLAQFWSMGLTPEQVRSYNSPYFGAASAAPNNLPPKTKPKP